MSGGLDLASMACEKSCLGLMVHPPGEECCHTCAYYIGSRCVSPGAGYFPSRFSRYLWY